MEVIPNSFEAEINILSAMLQSPNKQALIAETLTGDHFLHQGNREIFLAMKDLYSANKPLDAVTVLDALKSRNMAEQVGGAQEIAMLLDVFPTNTDAHLEILNEKLTARTLINTAHHIAEQAMQAGPGEISQVIDEAESLVFGVSEQDATTGEFLRIKDMLVSEMNEMKVRMQPGWEPKAVHTGIPRLDHYLVGGLHSDHLVLLAGRPSMGKTALALNIAANASIRHGAKVGFFSLEMSESELIQRLIATESSVPLRNIRMGQISDQQKQRISSAGKSIAGAKLYVDDSPYSSPLILRSKARRLARTHGVDLIIVDYLQLMRVDKDSGSRVQDVSEISRSLKLLARELRVPVLALSQLSRKCEEREDKRPLPSDLRDSGALEQDADELLFVYRPEVYSPVDPNTGQSTAGKAEIIVAKQRNGETGILSLNFDKEFTKFS